MLLFAEARRGEGSDPRRDKNAPIDVVMRQSTFEYGCSIPRKAGGFLVRSRVLRERGERRD